MIIYFNMSFFLCESVYQYRYKYNVWAGGGLKGRGKKEKKGSSDDPKPLVLSHL